MTKDEALELALEALDIVKIHFTQNRHVNEAITAIKQARALDKKAENARELGLDYEPAPKQRWAVFCRFCNKEWSVSYKHPGKSVCVDCDDAPPAQPAPVQEPHKGLSEHLAQATNGRVRIDPVTGNVGIGTAPVQEPEPACWQGEDGCPNGQACCDAQHCLYTNPPAAQRQWVGLTDEEIEQGCKESWVTEQAWQSAVWWAEAKLRSKNT
jgi:hypothetical protein